MSLLLSVTAAALPPLIADRTLTPGKAETSPSTGVFFVGFRSLSPAIGTLSSNVVSGVTLELCQSGSDIPNTLQIGRTSATILTPGRTVRVLIPSLSASEFQADANLAGVANINVPGIYAHLNGRIGVATPIGIVIL